MSNINATTGGKAIGSTTKGATAGTGIAGAGAVVLVYVASLFGLDVPGEVGAAVALLLGALGALVGGKLSPTDQARTEFFPVPTPAVAVADGDGLHRAEAGAVEVAPDDVGAVVTETVVEVQ